MRAARSPHEGVGREARPRVIVTGGESIAVLAAVRGLAAAGYEPWATASTPMNYAARSRAVARTLVGPDPADEPASFADFVFAAAERHSIDVVLPGTEAGLLALASRAQAAPPGVALGVPAWEIVARATDKRALMDPAATGFATPPTAEIAADEEDGPPVTYPAVVKPLRSEMTSTDGRLIHSSPVVVRTPAELRTAVAALPGDRWLVQPYVSDRIFGACGVAWRGDLVCLTQQRGRRIWPPQAGTVSYAETVAPDPDLERGVAAFVRNFGLSGLFQLQFLEKDDRRYLIDLNPRPYISLALAIAAGMNLPAIWAGLLLGREPSLAGYRPNVRWRSDEHDPRAILHALRASRRGAAFAAALPRRRTVHAVFTPRDPGPSLVSLRKLVTRFARTPSRPQRVELLTEL